jgi:hypothetical protein
MGLTNLGIFHTAIGIIAIVAAIISFVKYDKINLSALTGRIYLFGTLIASLTALGISKRGGYNPGHGLALLILFLVLFAFYLQARRKGNNRARFFENFSLSLSFFLSMIPTVAETFQRVPTGSPLAEDMKDPLIGGTLLVLFVVFIAGSIYQYRLQKKINT